MKSTNFCIRILRRQNWACNSWQDRKLQLPVSNGGRSVSLQPDARDGWQQAVVCWEPHDSHSPIPVSMMSTIPAWSRWCRKLPRWCAKWISFLKISPKVKEVFLRWRLGGSRGGSLWRRGPSVTVCLLFSSGSQIKGRYSSVTDSGHLPPSMLVVPWSHLRWTPLAN